MAVLWSLSLAGISFYGGPVSYGLFALFTLIPVISVVYLLFVVAFFRIYQEAGTKWLAANHAVPFYFILKNESYFGFAGIRIRFFSSFSTINGLDDGIEFAGRATVLNVVGAATGREQAQGQHGHCDNF